MDVSSLGYFPDLLDQIGRVQTEVWVSDRFMCQLIEVNNWRLAIKVKELTSWVHVPYLTIESC